MHRSRIGQLLIDCDQAGFERSIEFWSRALGKEVIRFDSPRYVSLRGRLGGDGGLVVLLQAVPREERAIHLDIESDDVEAEVARLERLGARRKKTFETWTVMEAPSGHAFCVVQAQRMDFPAKAAEWT
jgi:hypothetical protein